jgi:ABC-type lipoprotein release transport system permease subunit
MLRLALRNLLRNWILSGICCGAVALVLTFVIMGNNMNHGSYLAMLDKGISTTAGHVVVQGEGWNDDPDPLEHRVEDAAAISAIVQEIHPKAAVLQRIFLGGLLTSATNSVAVAVTAIRPDDERKVTDLHEKIIEGEGAWLEADDERGIVLGFELARKLEVGVGKKVVLMGQGKDEVASRLFRVRGLVRTGAAQADGFLAIVTLAGAQDFLDQPGAASQISLHLKDPADTDAALAAVKQALSDRQGVEILDWKEAVDDLYEFTEVDRATNNKIMFIIGLIGALVILNIILMSVMERMREFGVMLAIGMTPGQLRRLILTEGLLLGLTSALLGLLGGSLITLYLVKYGIDYSAVMGDTMEMSGVAISTHLYGAWDTHHMAASSIIAVFLSIAATIYPAWKAGKLQPVEAMRHV